MDCTEFLTIVAGEREDDLSLAESQAFESHLETCGACREMVSRAEEDLERLGQLADPPLVPASAWTKVDEAVRLQARQKPGREDPFAPHQPAPVAPAMPVTLARGALPAARSKPFLAVAAFAAAVAIVVAFLIVQPLAGHGADATALRDVKPPEKDDVQVVDTKVGPSFKKLEKQGPLVFIEGQ